MTSRRPKRLRRSCGGSKDAKAPTLLSYGDILYKRYIPEMLINSEEDFVIVVDADWKAREGTSSLHRLRRV